MYPNPAETYLGFDNSTMKISEIFIYDFQGNLVKFINIKQSAEIDVSNLSTGIYFIFGLNNTGANYSTKFIKK